MKLTDILRATQKTRRSIEVRWRRKYGDDNWPQGQGAKLLKPKRHILVCNNCGGNYLASTICRSCYSRVEAESKVIIEAIKKAQGLEAVDTEVAIKYQTDATDPSFCQGKRIVEIEKTRPDWFTSSQLQPEANPGQQSITAPSDAPALEVKIKERPE